MAFVRVEEAAASLGRLGVNKARKEKENRDDCGRDGECIKVRPLAQWRTIATQVACLLSLRLHPDVEVENDGSDD